MLRFRVLILCSIPLLAFAQVQENSDTLRTYKLEEIVVTARRGGGEVLEVPMAVGILEAREFASSRRIGLNDALVGVPGILVQSRGGGQDVRLTVRGFGARGNGDRSNAATIRGIKVLVDGFPETEPDGRTSLDLVDLNAAVRLEVIRSNASTLFGNASGGIVNVESQAFFTEPFISSNNVFGDFGLRKNGIKLGIPLGFGRFSLSASNSRFRGWRRQTNSTSTQVTSSLFSEVDETTRLKILLSAAMNEYRIPGPLAQSQFDSDPSQANPAYVVRDERRFNRVGRLGFSFSTVPAEDHMIEVLGYIAPKILQRSERGTFRDFNRDHVGGGLVYNWNLPGISWRPRFTAGVDEAYQDGTILFYNLIRGERGDSLRTNKREGANTFGIFAQAEFHPLEKVSLTIGARYDRQLYLSEVFAAGARKSTVNDHLDLDHLTPRAVLLYRFNPTHSLYVNIGGGVEAPAFNEVDPPPSVSGVELNPFLKPMKSTTYEVGIKGIEMTAMPACVRSFSYSIAAYLINIRDEIVPFEGGLWFFSAGRSQRRGVEVGAQLDLQRGISLKSAFTYHRASYQSYSNELGDFSGREVPGIPQTMFNAQVRYSPTNGFFGKLVLDHVSSYFADDRNVAQVPSYTILHSVAGYEFEGEISHVRAFIGVNNLTDAKYASSAFINPSMQVVSPMGQTVPVYLEPGLPRNFYGGLEVRLLL